MAAKATIFKAEIQVSDLDHHFYQTLNLTLARHPSETDERLMVRLAAFVLHAWQQPEFTRGLSSDDAADMWAKDATGEIQLWVDVGLPDERRIRKACSQSRSVVIYAYGQRNAPQWRLQGQDQWQRFDKLQVRYINSDSCAQLSSLTNRNMQLQATLQEGELWLGNDSANAHLACEHWYP